jgi:cardiolipin synthase
VLALKGKIHWWVTVVVMARDAILLTTAVVIILVAGYRRFPPSIFGKVTTFVQILLVFVVVTEAAFPAAGLDPAQSVLRYCVAFFTAFSGLHYSVTVARRLSGS